MKVYPHFFWNLFRFQLATQRFLTRFDFPTIRMPAPLLPWPFSVSHRQGCSFCVGPSYPAVDLSSLLLFISNRNLLISKMVASQRMKVANEKASKYVTMRGNVPKSSVSQNLLCFPYASCTL